MRRPLKALLQSDPVAFCRIWFCTPHSVHPNPRFFKHYWWIFHRDSPAESDDFLTDKYRMRHGTAMSWLEEWSSERGEVLVYMRRIHRLGPGTPFIPSSHIPVWAPSYDDDPDPPWKDGQK